MWTQKRPGPATDTIKASVSLTLGAEVERLTLTGSGNLNGTGNALANTLIGAMAQVVATALLIRMFTLRSFGAETQGVSPNCVPTVAATCSQSPPMPAVISIIRLIAA